MRSKLWRETISRLATFQESPSDDRPYWVFWEDGVQKRLYNKTCEVSPKVLNFPRLIGFYIYFICCILLELSPFFLYLKSPLAPALESFLSHPIFSALGKPSGDCSMGPWESLGRGLARRLMRRINGGLPPRRDPRSRSRWHYCHIKRRDCAHFVAEHELANCRGKLWNHDNGKCNAK